MQDIDPSIDTAPRSIKAGSRKVSFWKVATIAATTLALLWAEVSEAGIVTLPVWIDSIMVRGNISWPTSTGGIGEYIFSDAQGNPLFTGTGTLWAPTEGQPYRVTFEAMREGTNEIFDMIVEFENLRFTGSNSFEAGSLNVSNKTSSFSNSNYTVGNWDSSWWGDIWMIGNANITSAVPEPGTTALLLTGLAGLGVATRRRRSATGGTPATWTTQKPETSEEASV